MFKKEEIHAKAIDAGLLNDINLISGDESLMRRLVRYVGRLVKEREKAADPTLMTKEEFMARIEKAEAQYANGEYSEMLPGEDLTAHLKRLGYDI